MAYSIIAVEIVSIVITLLALIFNSLAIYTILQLQKDSSLSVGLGLILIVATYDLIGPSVGIIQEIFIKSLNKNILEFHVPCQILGTIETLVPFISTGAVALLSLERYLFIHQIILIKFKTVLIIGLQFIVGFILAGMAAIKGEFKLAPNRMICMVTPDDGFFGQLWYYCIMVFLIAHALVIIFCYAKIISLRRVLNKKMPIPIKLMTRKQHRSNISISSVSSTSTQFNLPNNFITNHFNELRSSNSLDKIRPISSNSKSSTEFKWYKPDRFVIKAVILMLAYLICILPGIIIMTYHAIQTNIYGSNQSIDPELSAIMFLPLFSISLINPILLLSLHTKASEKLRNTFESIFSRAKP